MLIDTESMISIDKVKKDFSGLTQLVDRLGYAVIIRDDHPRYLMLDLTRPENEKYLPKTINESE